MGICRRSGKARLSTARDKARWSKQIVVIHQCSASHGLYFFSYANVAQEK